MVASIYVENLLFRKFKIPIALDILREALFRWSFRFIFSLKLKDFTLSMAELLIKMEGYISFRRLL